MGFLDFLTRGLKKTRNNLVVQVDGISGKLTPETLEELEEILILSDGWGGAPWGTGSCAGN